MPCFSFGSVPAVAAFSASVEELSFGRVPASVDGLAEVVSVGGLRWSAWIISLLASVAGCVYAKQVGEGFWKTVLYTVAPFFLSTILFGALILVLKPFLALWRKKENDIHKNLMELEQVFLDATFEQLNSQLSSRNGGSEEELRLLVQGYINHEQETLLCLAKLRELKSEKARICEWKWVKSAALSICLAVLLYIAAVLFVVVLAVIVIVGFLKACFDRSDGYYDDKDYSYLFDSSKGTYVDDEDSFISKLIDKIMNSDKHITDAMEEVKKHIEKVVLSQRAIALQGNAYGFPFNSPEEPEYLNKVKRKTKEPKCDYCHKTKPVTERVSEYGTFNICDDCKRKYGFEETEEEK